MIRIAVVEDHMMFRECIIERLDAEPEFDVVGEGDDGTAALELVRTKRPDVPLLDLTLKTMDGVEAARQVKHQAPQVAIVILSMHSAPAEVERALEQEIDGYVLKDDAYDDLVCAVRAVLGGGRYISPKLLQHTTPAERPGTAVPPAQRALTKREKDILLLVVEGYANREIAERLYISVKTVETHRANIARKHGLRKSVDYVRHALCCGWIKA